MPIPMAGSCWFTTLESDLASGYRQVEMDKEDKAKTAFTMRYGLYEWNVMLFGLCNAPPATFQCLMEKVMAGLQWKILASYLDSCVHGQWSPARNLRKKSGFLGP